MKQWVGLDVGGTSLKIGLFNSTLDRTASFEVSRQDLRQEELRNDFDLLMAAFAAVNLRPTIGKFEGIAAGWAGYALPGQQKNLEDLIASYFPGLKIGVFSDAMAAHASAFKGGDGLLSIHGTGSLQLVKAGGVWARLNGMGPQIGDLSGGLSLGRMAIREAILLLQTGKPDELVEAFLAYAGTPDWLSWIIAARDQPEQIAGFAPKLCDLAQTHHEKATFLIDQELEQLNRLISGAGLPRELPFALHGGLARNKFLQNKLQNLFSRAGFSPVHPTIDAALGAILLLKNR